MYFQRDYTIHCPGIDSTFQVESDKFAPDIVREYFPDVVIPGQYWNATCYKFYSPSSGNIFVSWELENC